MPDLAAIPGVAELWELTLGEPSVRVAVIDGPADLTHPCFDGADIDVLAPWWLPDEPTEKMELPDDGDPEIVARLADEGIAALRHEHGTWVSSVLFGNHESTVPGLAPRCKGQLVPSLRGEWNELDPVSLAHAIGLATDARADVIVVELCVPTLSGDVDEILKRSLRNAAGAGVLVVAGSGNDRGRNSCFPAASRDVLAVGAYDDDGRVYGFSNWGPAYEGHGLVAPGGNIEGAIPGGGTRVHKGTSCSGPVAAGVAALLVSLQVAHGAPRDPVGVGRALVRTASPCSGEGTDGDPRRCIAGRLDVPAATRYVLDELRAQDFAARRAQRIGEQGRGNVVVSSVRRVAPRFVGTHVFTLGTLGYDFESEARRDAFTGYMAGEGPGADVRDERRVLSHLVGHPADTAALTWVQHVGDAPAYAIEPVGPYAADIHARLVRLLAAQLALDDARAERISLPGRLTDRRLELESGERVAVVEIDQLRGLHGLNVVALAAAAARHVASAADESTLRVALAEFLTKVHVDMANLGCTSPQRAMNFAATNAYQAAESFAAALADGMVLEAIDTQRSAICRLDSDCWDVCLRFFDPDNGRRARKVFRFTIDVSDVMPVTLGDVRAWSESKAARAAA